MRLRKSGKSYAEIKELLSIPKSTLSYRLQKLDWSKKIRERLTKEAKTHHRIRLQNLNKIRGRFLAEVYVQARREARQEFKQFRYYPLFSTGVALYWGEGDKLSKHALRISNADPKLIRTFISFLIDICGVSQKKIRAYLLLYPDLHELTAKKYWQKQLGLSEDNFNKCIIVTGRHKTRRLPYGVCTVTISSAYLKQKMSIWIELLAKN